MHNYYVIPAILSISELNRLARSAIEREFPLLWVAGEISNLTRAPSGHVYFSLKDAAAQVRCAMFRNRAQSLPWRLENGQQVEANVRVTLYEARGEFQLTIESLRRAGLGRLYEAFLRLREKLATAGLFDAARKRDIPAYPRAIGIVTSASAAALRDILVTLMRRAPHLPVFIYPTLVQGESAAAQIATAIETAGRRAECDLLIVARGGGSLEDLWAFNEEVVVQAIAACPLPVIAGIGHETDTTLADLAADLRAATPTAAAEHASAGWYAAATELDELKTALAAAMRAALERRMQALDLLAHRLIHPAQRLARLHQHAAHLATRLAAAARRSLHRQQNRLALLRLRLARARPAFDAPRARLARIEAALAALDPDATLARGYAIVRDAHGHIVRDATQLAPGHALSIRHPRGRSEAIVKNIFPD